MMLFDLNQTGKILFTKTVHCRTFAQCTHIIFTLGLRERHSRFKRCQTIEVCRRVGQVTEIIFLLRQWQTKFMKQCQAAKQNWAGQRNFGICFCFIFKYSFLYGRNTGC